VKSSRLQQLVLLVDETTVQPVAGGVSRTLYGAQWRLYRRAFILFAAAIDGIRMAKTPATELQHSWLFVLRTWGCTEPTFLPLIQVHERCL
jgi:hypothetical protein